MRGIIDGFNKSRRKIATGVVKKAGGSMSSIHFWTTPKGDLSNYSFIFRNTEPLGTKLKNVSCSRLGTMFYLEIKRGRRR